MSKLLFMCTGNYYRSRFAELYFRHLAVEHELDWQVDSRGLRLTRANAGPLSPLVVRECERLGIPLGTLRFPIALDAADLVDAKVVVAVKASEHHLLMREKFPNWERRIEYWNIHDLDGAPASEALPLLEQHVLSLFKRLKPD